MADKRLQLILGLGQALMNTGNEVLKRQGKQILNTIAKPLLNVVPDVPRPIRTPGRVVPAPTTGQVEKALQRAEQARRTRINQTYGQAAPRPRGYEPPAIEAKPNYAQIRAQNPPKPFTPIGETTQLRLPVAARREGYGVPRGKGAPSAEYTQAIERARAGMQPRMMDQPAAGFTGASPGQLGLDSLALTEPTGPLGRALMSSDPQTYKSVSDLAIRASQKYGVPVSAEDLLGSRGTSLLRSLEFDPSAIVRRPSAAPVRIDPGDLAYAGGRGALVRSPGGAVVAPSSRALPGGEPAIDVDWRVMGGDLARRAAGAPPVRFGNAVGGLQRGDLSKAYLPLGAGAAALGLALGGDVRRPSEPAYAPGDESVTQEDILRTLDNLPQGSNLGGAGAATPPAFDRPTTTAPAAPVLPGPGGGVVGQPGSGQVVIRMDDGASVQRQAAANAQAGAATFQPTPGSYQNARDYYVARAGYVAQPGVSENIREQLAQQSARMGQADMQAWAQANPALAYQMLQNSLPRGASQQTQNAQGAEITTELGSNTANNFVGNTNEAVAAAQGASPDLKAATDPQLRVSLQPIPRDLQAFYNRTGARFTNTSFR